METQSNASAPQPQEPRKRWKAPTVNEVGIFTVRENDYFLIKAFKSVVNYTMFGFVLFMTGLVWLVTMLVI